jgi:hypothetical protein
MRRLVLPLLLILCAPVLRATILVPADFREAVTGSQLIVYGRVIDVRPEAGETSRTVYTVVTVQSATVLRGAETDTVTFRVPGGQIGRYRNVVVGAPQFNEGEEVVVFLTGGGASMAHVFGFSQGVYRVRNEDGRRVVIPPAITGSSVANTPITRGAPERQPMPLENFAAQVRSILAKGAK